MKATTTLHELGQSLWLDNVTRELLNSGTLHRYIEDLSVTGLTSNPTIFDHAIKNSATYDEDISRSQSLTEPEDLFFELALADLVRAADLFRPVFARTDGVDGWVSLEVSPLLAHDADKTLAAALVSHPTDATASSVVKSLGDVGNAWAWKTPGATAKDEEAAVRETAARALVSAFVSYDGSVRQAASNGKTIFLSTHLLDMAQRLCSRVAIIDNSNLVAAGRLNELQEKLDPGGTLEEVFLKVTHGEDSGGNALA